ncbi:CoA transferase [Cryobacterium sp. Y57]|uniref:CoA transferase n=1 Tax=Cryobacterium sp. Y57 TaxID=2048287 RepID=UPI00351A7B2D
MRPSGLVDSKNSCPSPEHLRSPNPGLEIARISGYGQTGSNAHKRGYVSVAEAAGGLRHLNGHPDAPPHGLEFRSGTAAPRSSRCRAS